MHSVIIYLIVATQQQTRILIGINNVDYSRCLAIGTPADY